MCGIRSIANNNIFWNSGNGKVSFWHDNWCEFVPLSLFQPSKSKYKIEFFWTNGQWDRNKLISKLPVGICDHICSYPCGPSSNMPLWTLTSNGIFPTKAFGSWLGRKNPQIRFLPFVGIPLSPRPSPFLWLGCFLNGSQLRMAFFVGVSLLIICVIVVIVSKICPTCLFTALWLKLCGIIFKTLRE
ncbi:hypothetical protein OROMI_001213 [Orobanche minor]